LPISNAKRFSCALAPVARKRQAAKQARNRKAIRSRMILPTQNRKGDEGS
jgi:hypothetical protein